MCIWVEKVHDLGAQRGTVSGTSAMSLGDELIEILAETHQALCKFARTCPIS